MVLTTAIQALSHITSNSRVFIHSVAAAPQSLIEAMMHYSNALRNVEIIQLHTEGPAPYAEPGMEQSFKVNAFFCGVKYTRSRKCWKSCIYANFPD